MSAVSINLQLQQSILVMAHALNKEIVFATSNPIYFLETSVFIQYQRESVLDKSRNMLWNKERHLMIVMSTISVGYFTAIYL